MVAKSSPVVRGSTTSLSSPANGSPNPNNLASASPMSQNNSNTASPLFQIAANAGHSNPAASLEQGAEAIEIAHQQLRDLLQHPDDLSSKATFLYRKLTAEKSQMDQMILTGVRGQLEELRKSISGLSDTSRVQLTELSQVTLKQVEELCADSQKALDRFDFVRQVCRIHQNFVSTKQVYVRFQELDSEIDRVARLLKQDILVRKRIEEAQLMGKVEEIGPDISSRLGENLLLAHYHLTRIEEFRSRTMYQAQGSKESDEPNNAIADAGTRELVRVLDKFFEKLVRLNTRFEEHLFALGKNLLFYLRKFGAAGASLPVKIMKIIEWEEMEDEKSLKLEAALSAIAKGAHTQGVNPVRIKKQQLQLSRMVNMDDRLPRKIKSYRNLLMETLHVSVSETFERTFQESDYGLIKTLEVLKFVLEDLTLIYEDLVPKFPKQYNIFDFFVLAYHGQVYQRLRGFLDSKDKKKTQDLPYLIDWVNNVYYRQLNDRLAVSKELLEPKLLDDKDESLIAEYVKDMKKQVATWCSNVLLNATRWFTSREEPPEMDAKGNYIYSGIVVDLFNIIRQQVEHTMRFSKGKMLNDVVAALISALTEFDASLNKVVDGEVFKYKAAMAKAASNPNAEVDFPPGLESYLVTLSNSLLLGCDNLEEIGRKLEREMEAEWQVSVAEQMKSGTEIISKSSKHCYLSLAECIFVLVREPCLKFLFTVPKWYEDAIVDTVMATFDDYLSEMQESMNEIIFNRFTTEIIERFIIAYWEGVKNRNAKFKAPPTSSETSNNQNNNAVAAYLQMDHDYEQLVKVMQEYKPLRRLEKMLRPLYFLRELVSSSEEIALIKFYDLKAEYPDVKETWLEDILTKREDVSRTTVRALMDKIKKKIKEDSVSKDPAKESASKVTTIFSRMKDN